MLAVHLRDTDAINVATLDNRDLRVTGPNGFVRYAKFAGFRANGNKSVVARYKMPAPGGSWDASDAGLYRVRLMGGAVRDEAANGTVARTLGTFQISAPASTPLGRAIPQSFVNQRSKDADDEQDGPIA